MDNDTNSKPQSTMANSHSHVHSHSHGAEAFLGQSPTPEARLMRMAALASVSVASILIILKAFAWWFSGSISLLGSLTDSSLDLMASVVNFIAIRTALQPPDEDHRFGHGKAEAISGLMQAMLIMAAAAFLLWESIWRVSSPSPIERSDLAIGVSVIAIILTLGLVIFQKHVIARSNSVAIAADNLHYMGDLLMNVAVIAAIVFATTFDTPWADGAFGIAIALYIAKAASEIGRSSIDMLMDKEFDQEKRDLIINTAMETPMVMGIHDLKTRQSGLDSFIQFHIELPPDMTLKEAHFISDDVESHIGEKFPNAEIIIHLDPVGIEGPNKTIKEVV